MADGIKAQKLAAARKMLKEYRHKNKSTKKTEMENVTGQAVNQTPVDSLTSSTHSSDNGQTLFTSDKQQNFEQEKSNSPLQNYFSNITIDTSVEKPNNFFDTIPNDKIIENNSFNNYFNTSTFLNEQEYSSPPIYSNVNSDSVAIDYPELKQNEIYELHKNDTEKIPSKQSSVESLRQLSSQIAELVKTDDYDYSNTTATLEKRNQELASLLSDEKIKNEQLNVQLGEYQNQLDKLEAQLKETRIEADNRVSRDLGPLQDQLQCHVQTVGILVAEKTELSALLGQNQTILTQKTTECEELQARLKASRSRAADLEKELNAFKTEKLKYNKIDNQQNDVINKYKSELESMKEEKDEITQDLLEAREKLKTSSNENLELQKQIQDLSSQLSLANIKLQQITAGENVHTDSKVESLVEEKLALEMKIKELNSTIETINKASDQARIQYQQYAQQLDTQLNNLASKLESATQNNEILATREQNLVKHIGELEKHLQTLQNEHVLNTTQKSNTEIRKELENALEIVQKLENQKTELEENFTRVSNEKEMLMKDLKGKQESIVELESVIERLQGDQPDTSKLLATMESDKVAATRAVSQNQELKQRLNEMDEVFIKMTNDKMELTEQVTYEKHRCKEFEERSTHLENQLHTLAEAIAIKDRELIQLRDSSSELSKQVLQQSQLADRLRHYEAQDNSSQSLQVELQDAKHVIAHLSNENNKLKETTNENEEINLLKQKIYDLECANRNLELQLKEKTCDEIITRDTNEISSEIVKKDTNDNDEVCQNVLDKEAAMKHLEEKFLRTMQDIANLTEEKQRLEHIVLQLQGETETIGEYIALYQHQRGILKQRALEKDEQLKQLANDREQMKNKLEHLNALVKQLVVEKGALTAEVLEQHENLNKESHELCEEHAKIHQEINKITQENMNGVENSNGNVDGNSKQTAEQIIALLTEIKTSNLVQPTENFHPCPWCSGKLITV